MIFCRISSSVSATAGVTGRMQNAPAMSAAPKVVRHVAINALMPCSSSNSTVHFGRGQALRKRRSVVLSKEEPAHLFHQKIRLNGTGEQADHDAQPDKDAYEKRVMGRTRGHGADLSGCHKSDGREMRPSHALIRSSLAGDKAETPQCGWGSFSSFSCRACSVNTISARNRMRPALTTSLF